MKKVIIALNIFLFSFYISFAQKEKPVEIEKNNPPVLFGSGGPDTYGYIWVDSDEPGGPIFNWVDISALPTTDTLTQNSAWIVSGTFAGTDEGYFTVNLPFSFNFYGEDYAVGYIGSNGTFSFSPPTGNFYVNGSIPNSSDAINNMIAPFWEDLDALGNGLIFYGQTQGGDYVVQWVNAERYSSSVADYTFELILKPNGEIIYQYLQMGFGGGGVTSATIGIENADATDALQITANQAYIHNDLAVKITRPAHQIKVSRILNPLNGAPKELNQSFLPEVEFKNFGILNETEIPVELHIYKWDFNNEVYLNTQMLSDIPIGGTVTQQFDEFIPSDTGVYYVKSISNLIGDEITSDDTLISNFFVYGPLSGNYTVGTNGNFPTLNSVINLLKVRPVGSDVTFYLTDPVYNETGVTIDYIGDVGRSVKIKPAVGTNVTLNLSGTWAIRDSLAQYVIIDGSNSEGGTTRNLTINSSGYNAIRVIGSNNITVKNCILRSSGTTNTNNNIVYVYSSSTIPVCSKLVFENNILSNGYSGFNLTGTSSSRKNFNNIIRSNKIGTEIESVSRYGIYTTYSDSTIIEKNEIQNVTSSANEVIGIYCYLESVNSKINENYIHNIAYNGTSTFKVYGIYLYPFSSDNGTSSNNFLSNNIISDLRSPTSIATTYSVAGIYSYFGNGNSYLYNSVYLSGDLANNSAASYVFALYDTATIVANNIFANYSNQDTAKDYAIVLGSTTKINTLDYNLYYVSGTKGYIGLKGAAEKQTLQSWRDTTQQEQHSYAGYPRFTSTTDLHIPNGTKSLANNNGSNFSVAQDFDGDLRDGSTPDIGADEFSGITPLAIDVSVYSIDDPMNGRSKKANTMFYPKATFFNEATNNANTMTVNCKIFNSLGAQVYNSNKNISMISSFGSQQIFFDSVSSALLSPGNYTITVKITLLGDMDNTNDEKTYNFLVKNLLTGIHNVGANEEYVSFSQAIQDLKDVGVGSGGVTLNLTDVIYNESPITISGISGTSSQNPLTIKPNTNSTININASLTENFGIKIRGMEGVVIDGSNSNGSDRNLSINVLTSYGKYGIIIDSSTSPKSQRNILKNLNIKTGASNLISGTGYSGIWLNAVLRDTGNQVVNCDITNFGEAGIKSTKQHNLVLKNNYIHDVTQNSGATTMRGIWLASGTTYAQVIGNVISNLTNEVNGGSASGIVNEVGVNSNLLCANNMISGILSRGSGTQINYSRGIFSNASNSNDAYYYNSINMFGNDNSTSFTSRSSAIEFGMAAQNPKIQNNIIVNSTTFFDTTEEHTFGYYFIIFPTNLFSDYNDFYVPNEVVVFDGTGYRYTLSDWVGTSAKDFYSTSAYPKFVSQNDLHIQSGIKTIAESWGNVEGTTGIVDTDIDGNIRFGSNGYNGQSNLGSDLGADEGDFVKEMWQDITPIFVNNPLDGSVQIINSEFTPVVTFENVGFKKVIGFPVSFVIKNSDGNEVYNESAFISELDISYSGEVTFPPLSPNALAQTGIYNIEIKVDNDENPSNNVLTSTINVKGPLSGTFNIGSGGNYTTLTQAINELFVLGVSGNLTFNLTDVTYQTSPIVFDTIRGTNSNARVTFEGNNARLDVSGTDNDSAVIRFRGSSYITLRNLNLNPLWQKARYGIWLKPFENKLSSHNIIEQCIVRTGAISTSSSGYIGIFLDSLVGRKDTNNRIVGCDITKFGLSGIIALRNSGLVIEKNKVHDWTVSSGGLGTEMKGIGVGTGSTNTIVRGNTISNIIGNISGIKLTGIDNYVGSNSNFYCVNNMIMNIRSAGSGTSQNSTRGIASSVSSNSNDKYYFNTIILTGTSLSSAQNSYSTGIEVNVGSNTIFIMQNNNVYQSMTHNNLSAKSMCVKFSFSPNPNNWTSNYNNFYTVTSGETSPVFIGTVLTTDYSTLNAWKVATGKDVSSISADSRFVSLNDGHLLNTRPITPLNGKGVFIPSTTTDFDGNTRRNPPDIGADEVDVVNSISGFVINDLDANAQTSADRIPLANWTVYLYNSGTLIDTQTTDVNGLYSFQNITSGSYDIIDGEKIGWTSLAVQGGTGSDDVDTTSISSMKIVVSDGDDAIDNNFLNAQPGSLTIRIYSDIDGKYYTSSDRSLKNWNTKIYKDSVSTTSLISNVDTSEVIFVGAPGIYIVVQSDSSTWVSVGKIYNDEVDTNYNIISDTISIAAGTYHTIEFINFQRHSITIKSYEDDDGSFYFSSSDRTSKNWSFRLYSSDGGIIFDSSVVDKSEFVSTFLPAGTYIFEEVDSIDWNHLGYYLKDVTTDTSSRTTISIITISLANGNSATLDFVNTKVKPDTTKYRTFSQLDYSAKSMKLKPKKTKTGFIYPIPNGGNIRDVAFIAGNIGKGNPMYIGKSRNDSSKIYGWAYILKGSVLIKLLNPEMTGASTYFTFVKGLKDPNQKKLNNHLVGELIALKTSMLASDYNIVSATVDPNLNQWKLGDLLYVDEDTLNLYHGKSLREIIIYADSFLTYGKRLEELGFPQDFAKLDSIFTRVNRAFRDPSPLELNDTISYTNLRIWATMSLSESADFLRRDYIVPPKNFVANNFIPMEFEIAQNYPNPFNPTTRIEFELSEDAFVTLSIFNSLGQKVKDILLNEEMETGFNEIEFNGSELNSGIYFYRITAKLIETGKLFETTKKMVLVK